MTEKLDFTFELLPLPAENDVSLSEAMQFLRYGAVLKVRYAGTIPAGQIEGGYLSIAEDGHYVLHPLYSGARLRGPHALDIAKVGGALFGVAKDNRPDPEALESAEARRGLRLARHDAAKHDFAEKMARCDEAVELHRQWQVLSAEFAQQFRTWESAGKVGAKPECPEEPAIPNEPMPPTPPAALDTTCLPKAWQAEKERREAALQAHLNDAARSGKLKILGVQVDDPLCLAPSPARPRRAPSPIGTGYFHIDRYFDDEYGRIHYVDPTDGAAMEQDLIASLVGDPMRSYSNVTLEREGLLALAAEIVPTPPHAETKGVSVASSTTERHDLSDEEAFAILESERIRRAESGDKRPIPQNDGAEILRKEDQNMTRERGRAITKRFTGNVKTGPTGPRRNCAG